MTAQPIDTGNTGRVLVVDDHEPNRLLLRDLLEAQGHQVVEACDGLEGLARAGDCNPDIILLDINMPGLDGLEVCRRLKADPVLAALPVLMVTSLAQREQRLKGMEAGANDYITKPIDGTELTLRVSNAIRLRKLHRELESQYQRLENLERLRDSLVHMVVHDLRSPLAAIRAYLDLLRLETEDSTNPEIRTLIEEALAVVGSMAEMISDLLDISRFESGVMPLELTVTDLREIATTALAATAASRQKVEVRLDGAATPVPALCDPKVIRRVVINLVANAIKFTPSDGQVTVTVAAEGAAARIAVSDTGPGITPEHQARVFEKFYQVDPNQGPRQSTGLGLTFCKLAVEAHGGRIGVDSEPGQGSRFWVVLPS